MRDGFGVERLTFKRRRVVTCHGSRLWNNEEQFGRKFMNYPILMI